MDNEVIPATHLPDDPSRTSDERSMLVEFLDYYRAVLLRKCAGLGPEQLAVRLAPSTLTLGGLVKHLALVEDHWFHTGWAGRPVPPPWDAVDWASTPDWDLESAADDAPAALAALFDAAVSRSRDAITTSFDVDETAIIQGREVSLRWVLIHMIEEYARHCGHADLIRESIDGRTGD